MDDLSGGGGKLGAWARDKDRGENEPFEWTQGNTLKKSLQVEGAEDLAVTTLESITQAICEKRVAGQTLDLLDE